MYLKVQAPQTYDIHIGECKIEMIKVTGGNYQMGGDKSNPLIRLSDFWIGKYPVTQAIYQAITGTNPSRFKGKNKPVENVSWHDCKDFLAKLNEREEVKKANAYFRLPTEAEWEYAASDRGTSSYEYAGSNDLHTVGWYTENSRAQTQEVGLKMPSALGIYDLSGNVWEWCEDEYDSETYKKTPADMLNPVYIESKMQSIAHALITNQKRQQSITGRVIRGGGWHFTSGGCSLRTRFYDEAEYHSGFYGFRLLGIFSV